jgi:multiple sugar transport system ATP-binding protein
MNLVEATVDGGAVAFGGFRIPLPPLLSDTLPAGRMVLGLRPESFEDASFADPSLPQIDVVVGVVEELGSDSHVIFPIDAPRVDSEELRETREGEDESLLAGDQAVFNARVDPRTRASAGAPLRLAVDPTRFHFFDPATGENIGLRGEPDGRREEVAERAGSVARD